MRNDWCAHDKPQRYYGSDVASLMAHDTSLAPQRCVSAQKRNLTATPSPSSENRPSVFGVSSVRRNKMLTPTCVLFYLALFFVHRRIYAPKCKQGKVYRMSESTNEVGLVTVQLSTEGVSARNSHKNKRKRERGIESTQMRSIRLRVQLAPALLFGLFH